jgi:rhodanese-related sulfurtransferase
MRLGIIVLAFFTVVGLGGCGADKAAEEKSQQKTPAAMLGNPAAVLQAESDKYLKRNRPLYIEAQEVLTKAVLGSDQSYYLVDIRADEHYANAHIAGAIHIAYADVWREQKINYLPRDKKIIIIDYSGHTASQVAAFWGMLGYDAVAMKNGMAAWSADRDVIGGTPLPCQALQYPVVTTAATAGDHALPQIETKAATVAELLMKRSQEATETAPVIQPHEFNQKKAGYFIVDLRQPGHYQAGHIEGAVNIPFRTITEADNLKKLPPDKHIALVCYDGHASSQAARLLNQLGYRASALKDGMSVWVADERVSGAKTVACNINESPIIKLNAVLKPGPSTAAT